MSYNKTKKKETRHRKGRIKREAEQNITKRAEQRSELEQRIEAKEEE